MFVIAQRANQLGNRLFLFAHLIACAAEHRLQLVNLCFEEYAPYFETTSRDVFCRYPPKRSSLWKDPRTRGKLSHWAERIGGSLYEGRLKRLRTRRLIVLRSGHETTLTHPEGEVRLDSQPFLDILRPRQILVFMGPLFRDVSSFSKHAAAIRMYFQPLGVFADNVEALIKTVREGCELVIGVHIRRGDYRSFVDGRFFYAIEEYVGLMQRIQDLFAGRRVHFLVCSNEDQRAQAFPGVRVFAGSRHFIEDLYALAGCDYIVGPPSTFSAWASFYGQVPLYTVVDPAREPTLEDFKICRGQYGPLRLIAA